MAICIINSAINVTVTDVLGYISAGFAAYWPSGASPVGCKEKLSTFSPNHRKEYYFKIWCQ